MRGTLRGWTQKVYGPVASSMRAVPYRTFVTTRDAKRGFVSNFLRRLTSNDQPTETTDGPSQNDPKGPIPQSPAEDGGENSTAFQSMSARADSVSKMLPQDQAYLEMLQDMDGGVAGVEFENGEPVGLKAQVKSDMKRVI